MFVNIYVLLKKYWFLKTQVTDTEHKTQDTNSERRTQTQVKYELKIFIPRTFDTETSCSCVVDLIQNSD